MSDDFWSFVGTVAFAATFGFGGYFIADDPTLRYIGLGLGMAAAAAALCAVYVVVKDDLGHRRAYRKYRQDRLEERLNDLEVWREETVPTVQTLRDQIANLEEYTIKGGKGMEYFDSVSLWPLLIAFAIAALYFVFKKGARHE